MFLRLEFKDGDFALLKPCARADVGVLEYLLMELRDQWLDKNAAPHEGYNTLSSTCLRLVTKLVDLMPRVDSIEPIDVSLLEESSIVRNFIAVVGDNGSFAPSKAVELHTFEPLKSSKQVPPIEELITVDNVPLASSGDPDSDLLATLLCVTEGDAMSAQLIFETWDSQRIDGVIFGWNERHRDPEERKSAYMCALFDQWKAKNEDIMDRVRFRKR